MSTFEIGFLHKNGEVDFKDPNNKRPWYRGNLKIDGEEIPVVVFPSTNKNTGKTYLTVKPDRPNPNASANSNRPANNGSGGGMAKRYSNQSADLDDDIPFAPSFF
jgi:hypothetical protein